MPKSLEFHQTNFGMIKQTDNFGILKQTQPGMAFIVYD